MNKRSQRDFVTPLPILGYPVHVIYKDFTPFHKLKISFRILSQVLHDVRSSLCVAVFPLVKSQTQRPDLRVPIALRRNLLTIVLGAEVFHALLSWLIHVRNIIEDLLVIFTRDPSNVSTLVLLHVRPISNRPFTLHRPSIVSLGISCFHCYNILILEHSTRGSESGVLVLINDDLLSPALSLTRTTEGFAMNVRICLTLNGTRGGINHRFATRTPILTQASETLYVAALSYWAVCPLVTMV